jgi:hypothetical protein
MAILGMCGCPSEAALTLVKDGQPATTIIVANSVAAELAAPPTADKLEEAVPLSNAAVAAHEFQHYVQKITGAVLPIVSEDSAPAGPRVLIGTSSLTEQITGLQIPSGLTGDLHEEGFVIQCKDQTLVLAGNDAGPYYGTRYAVCDLLERLGVRWIIPGEFGEVIPRHATLTVPDMSIVERPDFVIRKVTDDDEWAVHNKLNARIFKWAGIVGDNTLGGSGSQGYLGGPDVFAAHPEWFALNEDGKTRNPRLVCMTHPGAVQLVADKCKAEARARRGSGFQGEYSTFAPDDGEPRCYCTNCQQRSLGLNLMITDERSIRPGGLGISQEWFYFVNEVLKEVNKEFPDWRIATNGYANRDTPPAFEGDPNFNARGNLVVMFANIYACTLHAWDDPHCWQNQRQGQMIRGWSALSDKVYLYQYNYTMLAGKGTPTPTLTRIAHNTKLAKQWGIWGWVEENVDNRLCNGLMERYLRAKLYWDADTDPNDILNDLCEKWYGPAAKPMRQYYDTLDQAIATTRQHGHEEPILPPVYTADLLQQLDKHIRQAEALAGSGPEATRVHIDRLIHDHLRQYVLLEQAKRNADYRQAIAHIDNMVALRERVRPITPFILSRHQAHSGGVPLYGDVVWEKPILEQRLAQMDGTAGTLVSFLPERARFRTDPHDDGYYEQWFTPSFNDASWHTISTAAGWEGQDVPGLVDDRGFSYKGAAWYRMNIAAPAATPDQGVTLVFPSIVNRVLVWINGRYAGASEFKGPWFRPNPAEIDISGLLTPGQTDQITLRVFCNENVWGANGLHERPYIYAKPAPQP